MSSQNLLPETEGKSALETLPYDQIHDPGVYVLRDIGALLRVPEDGVVQGRSPVIEIKMKNPLLVTRIAEDPYIPLIKARMLAANTNLLVNF